MKRVPQLFSTFKILRIVYVLSYWLVPVLSVIGYYYLSILLVVLWSGRYKIGISNNAARRRREIDGDLKGGIVTVLKIPVYRNRRKETFLHRVFKKKNYRPKRAGKAAGKSEHFRLSLIDVLLAKAIYLFFFVKSNIMPLVYYSVLLGFVIYVVLRHYN